MKLQPMWGVIVNIITSDHLPDDIRVTQVLGVVETTCPVRISQDGLFRSKGESEGRHLHHDALMLLSQTAPEAANIIYGVRVSTSVASFTNGTFLYITVVGTAAIYESIDTQGMPPR